MSDLHRNQCPNCGAMNVMDQTVPHTCQKNDGAWDIPLVVTGYVTTTMSEPTDEQRAEVQAMVNQCEEFPLSSMHRGFLKLIVERDAALAEAAMAGAAEDGAMQSANDLVQRLDKAEAELTKANERAEKLAGLLRDIPNGANSGPGYCECDIEAPCWWCRRALTV